MGNVIKLDLKTLPGIKMESETAREKSHVVCFLVYARKKAYSKQADGCSA